MTLHQEDQSHPVRERRVLIVDDLPDVRTTLAGLLSDEGYTVFSVSNRVDALEMVEANPVDVAVLDVRLDETDEDNNDGLILMHEMEERYPRVAIIILTGYADVKMVRESLQPDCNGIAPAFAFLEKSEVDQLVDYVNRAFKHVTQSTLPSVDELVAEGENVNIEFKSSMRWDHKSGKVNKGLQRIIATTIAGMLNGEGGYLLIGVADDGTILGIENDVRTLRKASVDGFQLALTDIVKAYLGLECLPYVHPHFEITQEKCICVISIGRSPRPVFSSGKWGSHKFWVRLGSSTHPLDVKAAMHYIRERWGSG